MINMSTYEDKAMSMGIDPRGKAMWETIRLIQIKEGYQPCFATKHFQCHEHGCLWWRQCQGMIRLVEVK